MADHLGAYMIDEDRAGPVIEEAVDVVDSARNGACEIARAHKGTLERWCTFDTNAHYETQKQLAFGSTR